MDVLISEPNSEKKKLYFYSPNSTTNAKWGTVFHYKMCPPIYLSEIVFFVEYLQEKSSKLHFSAEFLILEKLKIVWKALEAKIVPN